MHVYIYIDSLTNLNEHIPHCIRNIYIYMYMYICIYMYVCIYIYIYMYICIYVCQFAHANYRNVGKHTIHGPFGLFWWIIVTNYDEYMGFSTDGYKWVYPKWFVCWKIPSRNGLFRGTLISGNHHLGLWFFLVLFAAIWSNHRPAAAQTGL